MHRAPVMFSLAWNVVVRPLRYAHGRYPARGPVAGPPWFSRSQPHANGRYANGPRQSSLFSRLITTLASSPRCWGHAVAVALTIGCGASHDSPDAGAQDWAQIDVGDSSVEALRFTDDQHAFLAVSDGPWQGLHATADGAATWKPRELDVAPFGVGFSASLNTILVAGSGSKPVWTSTDRGALFMPVAWNQPGFPASVRFLDENTVIMGDAVGDRLFRSTDAGQTWTIHLFTREVLPGTHAIEVQGKNAWVVGGPAYTPDGTAPR